MNLEFKPYVMGKEAKTKTPIGTFCVNVSKDFVQRGTPPDGVSVDLNVQLIGCDFLNSHIFSVSRKIPTEYDSHHLENVIDDLMQLGVEKVKSFLRENADKFSTWNDQLKETIE